MKKKLLIVAALFLSGCMSASEFRQGSLNCFHTVSTRLMGTAQVVTCEKENQAIYVNSFRGTAGIEPVEKLVEAGVVLGVTHGVLKHVGNSITTDNVIRLAPPGQ